MEKQQGKPRQESIAAVSPRKTSEAVNKRKKFYCTKALSESVVMMPKTQAKFTKNLHLSHTGETLAAIIRENNLLIK
jgi:hypothetical protein